VWESSDTNSASQSHDVAEPLKQYPRGGFAAIPNAKGTQTSPESERRISAFRINTCASVASKGLYLSLESTLMKKPGEGGGISAAAGEGVDAR
jgi:hypothetical protein